MLIVQYLNLGAAKSKGHVLHVDFPKVRCFSSSVFLNPFSAQETELLLQALCQGVIRKKGVKSKTTLVTRLFI